MATADGLIIRSDKVDAAVLDAAKQLKVLVRAGAGYDNVDLAAATAHGVCVENTPGQNSNAVAELVFGMTVMAEQYGSLIFVLAPGAFIALGYLIAIVNKLRKA